MYYIVLIYKSDYVTVSFLVIPKGVIMNSENVSLTVKWQLSGSKFIFQMYWYMVDTYKTMCIWLHIIFNLFDKTDTSTAWQFLRKSSDVNSHFMLNKYLLTIEAKSLCIPEPISKAMPRLMAQSVHNDLSKVHIHSF